MSKNSNDTETGTLLPVVSRPAETRSRLEQLPVELLSHIFDRLGEFSDMHKAPFKKDSISRTLLPFVRQILFREVTFPCFASFLEFCAIAQTTTGVSVHVTQLVVKNLTPDSVVQEGETATVLRFIAAAPKLVTLHSYSPRLSLIILSHQFSANLASAGSILNSLSILFFTGGTSQSLVEDFRHVGEWSALRELVVQYEPIRARTGGMVEGLPAVRLSNVTDLKLKVPESKGETSEFLHAFARLSSLDIEYDFTLRDGSSRYADIHDALNHDTITKLAIKLPWNEFFSPPDPDTLLLLDFTNLTHLFLNAPFELEPLIMGIGRLSSLERITIGSNLDPNSIEIARLFVEGRSTSLRVIALEHFRYASDLPALEDYYDSSDGEEAENGEWIEKPSHTLPMWSESFSINDAEVLQDMATEFGINLGRVFRAEVSRTQALIRDDPDFDASTVESMEGDEDSFGQVVWLEHFCGGV